MLTHVLCLPFQPRLGIYPLPQFLVRRQQRPVNLNMIRQPVQESTLPFILQRYYDFSLKTE